MYRLYGLKVPYLSVFVNVWSNNARRLENFYAIKSIDLVAKKKRVGGLIIAERRWNNGEEQLKVKWNFKSLFTKKMTINETVLDHIKRVNNKKRLIASK